MGADMRIQAGADRDFLCLHSAILFIFIYRAAVCSQLESNGRMSLSLVHMFECVFASVSLLSLCACAGFCVYCIKLKSVRKSTFVLLSLCVCVRVCGLSSSSVSTYFFIYRMCIVSACLPVCGSERAEIV